MYIFKIAIYLVAINMYGWEIKESSFYFSETKMCSVLANWSCYVPCQTVRRRLQSYNTAL